MKRHDYRLTDYTPIARERTRTTVASRLPPGRDYRLIDSTPIARKTKAPYERNFMIRRVLLSVLFALAPILAFGQGVQRCNLDTSNPAITHAYIPIHGGSFQGVFGYAGPQEWVPVSWQGHWASDTTNGMPFDDGSSQTIGPDQQADFDSGATKLLNGASVHIHMETCLPYLGEITGPIVVPFQIRAFHLAGTFYLDDAPMVRDVVFDNPPADGLTWHKWPGKPMDVAGETGHLTLNPFAGDSGPNFHQAMPNGWTIFSMAARALLDNGDNIGILGSMPIFTKLDPSVAEDLTFKPDMAACVGVTSAADPQDAWASQCIEPTRFGTLPLLAPFNADWPIEDMNGYEYASVIDGTHGTTMVREDLDLHNGIAGTPLPWVPAGNSGPVVLTPSSMTPGTHRTAFIWQSTSGPNGVPDPDLTPCAGGVHTDGNICQAAAIPHETVTALFVVNLTSGPAPPITTCTNPASPSFGKPVLPCAEPPNNGGTPITPAAVATLASVSVDPASIEWNSTATGTVTLTQVSNDRIIVDLRSFNEFVGVPGQVTILPGQLSVTFPITAGDRTGPGSAQINATSANTVSAVLSLAGGIVAPPPPPPPPPPPTDVCPNIDGAQPAVPDGMQLVNGQCVAIPPPAVWTLGTVFSKPNGKGVQFELCPGADPNDVNCQPK